MFEYVGCKGGPLDFSTSKKPIWTVESHEISEIKIKFLYTYI